MSFRFNNSNYTEHILGFKTFEDFKLRFEKQSDRKQYLKNYSSEDDCCGLTVTFNNDDRITNIRRKLDAPYTSAINWAVLGEFTHLEGLTLRGKGIIGTVEFEKLPRTLISVDLGVNELSGTLNFEGLPPALQYLYLDRNRFTKIINPMSLPSTVDCLTVQGNPLSRSYQRRDFPQTVIYFSTI